MYVGHLRQLFLLPVVHCPIGFESTCLFMTYEALFHCANHLLWSEHHHHLTVGDVGNHI